MALFIHLFTDRLEPRARLARPLEPGVRAIYVAEGAARISSGATTASLPENAAIYCEGAVDAVAGPDGARLLRWDVVETGDPEPRLGEGDGVASSATLSSAVTLGPRGRDAGGYLLRCDRVDFPPGGEAFLHTHQGPGTRCLTRGRFTVETQGRKIHLDPGAAWFESGPDPVHAVASGDQESSFVRVMILPRDLAGKSSIQYVRPEDRDRPKSQRYQVFLDQEIPL